MKERGNQTPKTTATQSSKQKVIAQNSPTPSRFQSLLERAGLRRADTYSIMTRRQQSRYEREQFLTRVLLGSVAGVLLFIVFLIGFGYWNEFIRRGQEPIAIVSGQPILTETYARVYGYEQTNLIDQYQRIQQDIQQIQASGQTQEYGFLLQLLQQQQQTVQSQLRDLQNSTLDRMIEAILIKNEAARRTITASDVEINEELVRSLSPQQAPEEPEITPTAVVTGTATSTGAPTTTVTTGTPTVQAGAAVTTTPAATATAGSVITPTADVTGTPRASGVTTPTAVVTGTPAATVTGTITSTTPEASPTPAEPTPSPTPVDPVKLVADFRTRLGQIGILSEAEYIEWFVRPEVLRKKLSTEFAKDAPTSGEQVRARIIEIYSEEEAKKAEEKLKAGTSFEEVVKEFSQSTTTKEKGGDLGWFPRNSQPTIPKVVEDAAFDKLQVGQTSEILNEGGVFYIVKLEEKTADRPFDPETLKQVQDRQLTNWLSEKKKDTGTGKTIAYNLSSERDEWVRKYIQRTVKR